MAHLLLETGKGSDALDRRPKLKVALAAARKLKCHVGVGSRRARTMWKSDIICPECGAGYRRIVISSSKGVKGEYRCLTCDHVLEVFEGGFEVLIRLRVPPVKTLQ
jgi:hypothetical protein